MLHLRFPTQATRTAGVLALALLLVAGCGGSSGASAKVSTATPARLATATATATVPSAVPSAGSTPTPTIYVMPNPLPTPPADPLAVCGNSGGAPLSVTKASLRTGYGPGRPEATRLPDDLAQKPQALTGALDTGHLSLDDSTLAFFDFSRPPSGQTGYICGVTVRIQSFQPLPGAVPNVTATCMDQWYNDPGGWSPTTACAAAGLPAGEGNASFGSAAVGATAASAVINPFLANPLRPGQEPPWVESIAAPGSGPYPTTMSLGIRVPQAGTYTFSVAFWQDRSGPTITTPNLTETFVFGQVQHEWGGAPCQEPAMQSQLPPPTNPPTQVICPGPFTPRP